MSRRYTPDPRLIKAIEANYGSMEDIVLQPHYTLHQHLMMPENNMLGVVYGFLKMSKTFMWLIDVGLIEMCEVWHAQHRGAVRIPLSCEGAEELTRTVYAHPVCLYMDVHTLTLGDLQDFIKVIEAYDFFAPEFDVVEPRVI